MEDIDDIESPWNKHYEDYINGGMFTSATLPSAAREVFVTPSAEFVRVRHEPDFDLTGESVCGEYTFSTGKTYSMFCSICGGPMTARLVSAGYDSLERCREIVLARLDAQCDCPRAICINDRKEEELPF